MTNQSRIEAIVAFVSRHPESLASRRICRELRGAGVARCDTEFAAELTNLLEQQASDRIDLFYTLIR